MSDTPDHLTHLESALAGLVPSAGGLSRDRLMFEAGKNAAPRRRGWPITAAAFAGLSVAMASYIALRLEPEPQLRTLEVVRYVPAPVPPRAAESPPLPIVAKNDEAKWGNAFRTSAGYLSRRDQVLFFGVDALPATLSSPESPREPNQDFKALHGSL